MSYRNKGILNHQNGKTLPPSKTPGQPNDEAGAVTSNLSKSKDNTFYYE